MDNQKTKVLIIDDSECIRSAVAATLKKEGRVNVIGTAQDAYAARDMIVSMHPDVLAMDIEMANMDMLSFIRKLIKHCPIPVVALTSGTSRGCEFGMAALEAGAADIAVKPESEAELDDYAVVLAEKLIASAEISFSKNAGRAVFESLPKTDESSPKTKNIPALPLGRLNLIAAGTGSLPLLQRTLAELPRECPATLIRWNGQDILIRAVAERFDAVAKPQVKTAEDGAALQPGNVIFLPRSCHTVLEKDGPDLRPVLKYGSPVNGSRASLDLLFKSAARTLGPRVSAVILNSPGYDGMAGLSELAGAGASIFALNPAFSPVRGLNAEVRDAGLASKVFSADELSGILLAKLG